MREELIPCPIDGTNLVHEIYDSIFDDGDFLGNNNIIMGFIDDTPAIVKQSGHILTTNTPDAAQKLYNRLSAILAEGDEDESTGYSKHHLELDITTCRVSIYYLINY